MQMERKSVIFMGSDAIALPTLKMLNQAGVLVGVISNIEKAVGRGQRIQANVISQFANDQGIPLHTPIKPNEQTVQWVKDLKAKLIVVMAYGHLLKRDLFDSPDWLTVNLHASILPKHRGASPITGALLAGDQETGVSLMRIAQAMDAGPVLDIQTVSIDPTDTTGSLREKLAQCAANLLNQHLETMLSGQHLNWQEQDSSHATYTKKISKQDGLLDFQLPAAELERRVRAYDPWPGSYFELNGVAFKVWNPCLIDRHANPGQFLGFDPNTQSFAIATSHGSIGFKDIQKPGGKRLPAELFLRGFAIPDGTFFTKNIAH